MDITHARPMPLVRIPAPFDHPDWLFELKHDGFRALAHVDGHHCRLVSRNGHEFGKWDVLKVEIAHSIRAMSAVLDGEIVCLDRDGLANMCLSGPPQARIRQQNRPLSPTATTAGAPAVSAACVSRL